MIRPAIRNAGKHLLLTTLFILLSTSMMKLTAQVIEIHGSVHLFSTDTINTGETVIVRKSNGMLAERKNLLTVSPTGDTLFNGTNWVIVPGVSVANFPQLYFPVDGDGNIYDTVQIGTQVWLSSNLRTARYNDHSIIPKVSGNSEWGNLTSPAYCWPANDSITYVIPYGALYNYYAVADTNSKNVCPLGWHVPTDTEWSVLINFLDGQDVAGGKMKEEGTQHWSPPNTGATNSSGFTAVGGGNRNSMGIFDEFGTDGFLWSSTEHSAGRGYYRQLSSSSDDILRFDNLADIGFSVRCLKD